jgi:hypothetical protein
MKRESVLIVVFFIYANFICCASSQSENIKVEDKRKTENSININIQHLRFDSTIVTIDKSSIGSVSWDGLFLDGNFIRIYENGSDYIDSVVNFLQSNIHTVRQDKIAICCLQKLEINQYLEFSEKCKKLFLQNKISEDLMYWIINPNFSQQYLMVRNYNNPQVIDFLNDLRKQTKISKELEKKIDSILRGDIWNTIKEMN